MVTLPTMLIVALWSPPPGVPGDTCSDSIAIIEGATTYDTTNHTDSGYDLYSTCDLMGILARDVWFQYDAVQEGIVTVSTCDPDSFDTSIIVYEAMGTGCDELEYLACNGDAAADGNCQPYHSVAEFPVTVGCTYLVRVGGWVESSWGPGTLALSLDDQALPNYCPTDINEDDATDVNDILAIISQWGICDACPEDIDEDGDVGVNDILAVIADWGPCPLQGSWQVFANSPIAPYLHHDDIAVIGDTIWICNVSGEIFKSTDAGESWVQVADQEGTSFRSIDFIDEQRGVVGNLGPGSWVGHTTDTNPLYMTSDGGLTWTPVPGSAIDGDLPDGVCGIQWVDEDTIHGAGRYAGKAYVISSTDGGATWTSRDLNDDFYAFVDVWFKSPMHGYITGTNRQGSASLVETHDGGLTWTTRKTNQSGHYWKMGFASSDFGYAVCSGGADMDIWVQTHDGGGTWAEQSFTDGFHANGIGFLNDQVGWIGGYPSHTLQTWNGGQTWEPMQIDMVYGDVINKFLKVDATTMYAVGNRVYKYSTDPPIARADDDDFDNSRCAITATTRGDATTITYTVPEDGHVTINIFVRGSLIEDRPVDAPHAAGTYSIKIDTPSGDRELFASIQTGRYRQWTKFANVD